MLTLCMRILIVCYLMHKQCSLFIFFPFILLFLFHSPRLVTLILNSISLEYRKCILLIIIISFYCLFGRILFTVGSRLIWFSWSVYLHSLFFLILWQFFYASHCACAYRMQMQTELKNLRETNLSNEFSLTSKPS